MGLTNKIQVCTMIEKNNGYDLRVKAMTWPKSLRGGRGYYMYMYILISFSIHSTVRYCHSPKQVDQTDGRLNFGGPHLYGTRQYTKCSSCLEPSGL